MTRRHMISVLVLSLSVYSSAAIINIPSDFTTIQEGIDSSSNGDTVLVQPGTYVENINFNGHNIVLASLYLTTEDTSYISQTIIDGDSSGTVVTFAGNEDSTTIIMGFTISKGLVEGNGGGIYCDSADPKILNNHISWNKAFLTDIGGIGGGIYCNRSNSIISNNQIHNNHAKGGGGIDVELGRVEIKNNRIYNNSAYGGYGGGIRIDSNNSLIDSNIISNNYSEDDAGGIYSAAIAKISNNIISYNYSAGFNGAGGILCGSDTVINNYIYGNITEDYGGGILAEGNSYIANNLILYNSAFAGGGIATRCSDIIINNTVAFNNAIYLTGGIGCYFNYSPIVKNNICWDNYPNSYSNDDISQPTVVYNNIEGGWPGEGNIDCNPMFCNPDEGDFHIADVSCCVGAGEGGADIGAFGIGCYALEYLAGDANMMVGQWPPQVIGGDVTWLVHYFRGGTPAGQCLLNGFYASGDVNADCRVIGSDVTRLVSYFRGTANITWCPIYPPAWLTTEDCPEVAPEGWPGCEEYR